MTREEFERKIARMGILEKRLSRLRFGVACFYVVMAWLAWINLNQKNYGAFVYDLLIAYWLIRLFFDVKWPDS